MKKFLIANAIFGFVYLSAYVSLRATGIYYPYFSQGSWEIDFRGFDPDPEGHGTSLDVPVFYGMLPLWAADQGILFNYYGHYFNDEPIGG